jgi:hypothetical protein
MSSARSGRTYLLAHGKDDPAPDEWAEFVADLGGCLGEVDGLLVFTAGASINANQRGQVVDLFRRGKLRGAVLTDSVVVRGAVTAIQWFGVPIAAFKPSAPADALAFLAVAAPARADVLATLERVKADVL